MFEIDFSLLFGFLRKEYSKMKEGWEMENILMFTVLKGAKKCIVQMPFF